MNNAIKQLEPQCWEMTEFGLRFNHEKYAKLIAYECIDLALGSSHRDDDMGAIIANKIKKYFRIEE